MPNNLVDEFGNCLVDASGNYVVTDDITGVITGTLVAVEAVDTSNFSATVGFGVVTGTLFRPCEPSQGPSSADDAEPT